MGSQRFKIESGPIVGEPCGNQELFEHLKQLTFAQLPMLCVHNVQCLCIVANIQRPRCPVFAYVCSAHTHTHIHTHTLDKIILEEIHQELSPLTCNKSR